MLSTRRTIAFLFVLFEVFAGVGLGQGAKHYHPSMIALANLLHRVKDSDSRRLPRRADMDSLVLYYKVFEELGQLNRPMGFSRNSSDSVHIWAFAAFNKLSMFSKYDTTFIRTLLLLESIIKRDVELAESMPEFVQHSMQANTRGFLQVFLTLDNREREDAVEALDWPSDCNVKQVLTDYAAREKIKRYKRLASEIAEQINDAK